MDVKERISSLGFRAGRILIGLRMAKGRSKGARAEQETVPEQGNHAWVRKCEKSDQRSGASFPEMVMRRSCSTTYASLLPCILNNKKKALITLDSILVT